MADNPHENDSGDYEYASKRYSMNRPHNDHIYNQPTRDARGRFQSSANVPTSEGEEEDYQNLYT